MNILMYLLMIIGGGAGVLSALYLTIAIPVVIVWKIYRKIKYRISLFD